MTHTIDTEGARSRTWDAIIIGAGMGGGLVGRRLAEQGLSVLFVEKGPFGPASERVISVNEIVEPQARKIRGFWPKPTESRLDGQTVRFFGPYGCGVGGSSVFYSAALERPERHDLDDVNISHPTGGWPVGYDAFRPYFDEASRILHLSGTQDPLSNEPPVPLNPPLPLPPGDANLMEELAASNLHPYQIHLSIKYPDKCRSCFGSKCPWGCKMDGRSAGVMPALETERAKVIDNCEVLEILDDGKAVTEIRVRKDGEAFSLTGQVFVLCAGSLGSARLLLASNSRHENGCANSSDLVGRGLMFHLDEYFCLWPRKKVAQNEKASAYGKCIAFRDIYSQDGKRFGLVQSLGMEASYGNLVNFLGNLFDQSFLRRYRRLRGLTRIPAILLSRLFGNAAVFTAMLEDFPYDENRVVLNEDDPEVLTFEYTFHKELLERRKAFRKALGRALRGRKRFMVSLQPVLNFGHPVGTLRFGTDPAKSVLNSDCRSHDLDNLYIADASFMPSALGVNPSLTIAANALRVGDIIAERYSQGRTANVQ